jgi:dienelactone hydrolase
MATPRLTTHRLAGYLGDILLDVRTADAGTARPAVLVVHGFKGFKDWGMFPPLAERLARAGFTAVSFNLSGSGVDQAGEFSHLDRFARATFSGDLGDLTEVIDALVSGGLGMSAPPALGLLGHSRGGGLAVLAAARDSRIRALVTWAPVSHVFRWTPEDITAWRARGEHEVVNTRTGQVMPIATDVLDDIERNGRTTLDIQGAAAAVGCPWLIVHGASDESVPSAEGQALADASGGLAELAIIPAAGHTFGATHPWRGPTPEFDEAARRTLDLFRRALL